jgi:hypothetical protein
MGWRDLFSKIGIPTSSDQSSARAEPEPLRNLDDLEAFIEQNDLRVAAAILRQRALPCFNLIPDGSVPLTSIGLTRLGGRPDLPTGTDWPQGPDGPLAFLAQFDLADVAHRCGPSVLPAQGLLSFFSELHDVHPGEGRKAVVLHTMNMESLRSLEAPEGLKQFNAVGLRFEPGITLPVEEIFFEEALSAVAPDFDHTVFAERCGSRDRGGQLLGHSITFQDDLQARAALAAMGHPVNENLLIWDTPEKWESAKQKSHTLKNGTIYRPWSGDDDGEVRWLQENRQRIAQELRQWQLLFRLDSNREMDLWINDADSVHLFIRNDALKAADFSKVSAAVTQS